MPWDGDISRMGQLADRIADLATVPSAVAAKVAVEIEGLIEKEFDEGHDPYGTAWEPLSKTTTDRGRTPPPLTDTHQMRDTLKVAPLPHAGISVTIDHPAAPHQTGWSGPQGSGPARPILPDRDELPESWQEVIEDAIVDEVERRMKG
jgi:Phage virion morphogenesis family